jgi:pyruvate,orthophosphate dikinase
MTDGRTARLFGFADPLPAGVEASSLLGGKAAGLAVMARDLGLPVPPGFVATTGVCREYLSDGWPQGLDAELRQRLAWLAEQTGREFGNPEKPLLVSVRSGAPISMPGMMDTLLNVGMTPAIRQKLAEDSGDPVFAADTWLRFNRMYAEIVLNAPRDEIAGISIHDGTAEGILGTADRVRAAAQAFGGIPDEPFEQLKGAICTVFASWECERAIIFRAKEGISAGLGTAATVQAMVFGNLDDKSGTGVAFTRDPSTGERKPTGDYLARAQGEDVVAGTHRVHGLGALSTQLPEVASELFGVMDRLERHYRDMCDIEFTVSAGRLYLLQTRIGRRSPLAAVRIAVDMGEDPDFPVSRAEAAARVSEDTIAELARLGHLKPGAEPIGVGLGASPGVGAGALCLDASRAAELGATGTAVVLARPETSPSDVHGMAASAGLLTPLGGVMSHAAVVARGWAIPAVCSLEDATVDARGLRVGQHFIAEGDTVTVDGTGGRLFLGDQREEGAHDLPELQKLREWASENGGAAPATGTTTQVGTLEVLRTLQLKGLATADKVAGTLGAAIPDVEAILAAHESLMKTTARGFVLTADGRAHVESLIAQERAGVDAQKLESAFAEFMPLNHEFKKLVTGAQQQAVSGPGHEGWEPLLAAMDGLHTAFRPIVTASGEAAPRLSAYVPRFDAALAALKAGDQSMLASPLKDSYHTVWFEYHEEMIALTGRDRATEEAKEGH